MNEQIALSIIVPVYNLEVFLPEALASLLKIDFEAPYEIIVVDDGSSEQGHPRDHRPERRRIQSAECRD